jgi:hypothetical protein
LIGWALETWIEEDYQCVLCQNSTEETIVHLLFYYPFAKNCWGLMNFYFADHLSI